MVARANARRLGLRNATPPYVAKRELRELPIEIRRFEPIHVLTDHSVDGLGLIGRTVAEAGDWLRAGGWLLIEVSPDRARAVSAVLRRAGFVDVRSTVDAGFKVTRVVVARWRP
jgi:release factor glutamine methyltransferase